MICPSRVFIPLHQAFEVAERELGIPALLDPDELVSVEEPDLLSIITYVSQLHCVFRRNSHGTDHERPLTVKDLTCSS